MDLPAPLKNTTSTAERLNAKLAPGLSVSKIEIHSGDVPQKIRTTYNLTLPGNITDTEKEGAEGFINSSEFIMRKTRKGKTTAIDIRPLIVHFSIVNNQTIEMQMISASAQAGIKPLEALTEILGLDTERSLRTRILKTAWHKINESN
jgi:hypothetical protein